MDKEFGKKAIEEAQQHASKYENIAFALQQVETLSETAVQQMINARLGPEAGFLAGGLYRLNNSFLKLASQIALDENKYILTRFFLINSSRLILCPLEKRIITDFKLICFTTSLIKS